MTSTLHGTSPTVIASSDTLNEIVAQYPQTLPVLQRFGLDTCCGGALRLCVAAEHHNLDLEQVLAELSATAEGDT